MEIQVDYMQLNELGTFLDEQYKSLSSDKNDITQIITALSNSLLGSSYVTIFQRMNNFNEGQFSKLISYTNILAEDLKLCGKLYNMEEDEFESRMKSEEARYE